MSWKVGTEVDRRREFVALAESETANMTELCSRFGISRKTGYKWLNRYSSEGVAGLENQSRRPTSSPGRSSEELERRVLELRAEHTAWGGRKLRRLLQTEGFAEIPSASTITEILRRHGKLSVAPAPRGPYQRFERDRPNELWQMDFKGHFSLGDGSKCHPLTVLDDHSRYSVVLEACPHEQGTLVRSVLTRTFRVYGLPEEMLMDNGAPWGNDLSNPWTPLTVWLSRLGIRVIHGRPYHPQTQGKEERFHRTLKAEVLQQRVLQNQEVAQREFDRWRPIYNCERPHDSLELEVPASRYQPSQRRFPEQLPEVEFSPGDAVRKVQQGGEVHFQGQTWHVSKAFRGERVGVRPTQEDGVWEVWFGIQFLGKLDLREEVAGRRVVRRRGTGAGGDRGVSGVVRCAHSAADTPISE